MRRRRLLSLALSVIALLGLGLLPTHSAFASPTSSTSLKQNSAAACPQLPPHFDPVKATASELRYLHLPPRPKDSVQLADWISHMRKVKHIICDSSFTHTNLHVSRPSMSSKATIATNGPTGSQSDIWSGYQDTSDTYEEVKGQWNVQCLGSQFAYGEHVLTWVGVDGDHLVQAGTFFTSVAANGYQAGYYPWYEFYPYNNIIADYNDPLTCGTTMYVDVSLQTYPLTQWCTDISWGSKVNYQCFDPLYTTTQSAAEWIDERPTCTTGLSPLADFNYTDFSDGYAESTTRGWHTIGGFPRIEYYMTDIDKTTVLAQPESLQPGTTAFRDDFKNNGPDASPCYSF